MELLRGKLKRSILPSSALKTLRDGVRVRVAGLVVCIQRPPTAKGVAFLALEDENGLLNVIIDPQAYERYRSIFKLSPFVSVRGVMQRRDEVIHLKAQSFEQLVWD